MPLLPLDLILTVGSAAAAFLLGLTVSSRNKWSTGSALFSLCAFSLAMWSSSDWFLSLQSTALPFQVLFWKLLFNATVCFGPALAMHVSAHISRRNVQRDVPLVYIASLLTFVSLAMGLLAPLKPLLGIGAFVAFVLYIGALVYAASHLYPVVFSSSSGVLERRRSAYGIILIILFIIAGALQLVVGPMPTGLVLSGITIAFLVISLAAFIRASLLDVTLGGLEGFLLLLGAFAVVLLLRTHDATDTIFTLIGIAAVGVFGSFAVKTVGSERHKREVLEQANRELRMLEEAKGDFVDMVAHQLRTPLGGIRSSSAMLRDGDYGTLPEKAKNASALIEDAATRLLSLADTFLSMSRVEVGNYHTRRVEADVRHELDSVMEEMRVSAKTKHLTLEAMVGDDVPKKLKVDTDALRNALFNLIDNAIKYTDRGRIDVSERLSNGFLVVQVRDTGLGMSPEDVRDLFKKFHRGEASHTRAMDGTGLGLYVVRRLLEAAGGRISASSEGEGKGSTFTVSLPIESV